MSADVQGDWRIDQYGEFWRFHEGNWRSMSTVEVLALAYALQIELKPENLGSYLFGAFIGLMREIEIGSVTLDELRVAVKAIHAERKKAADEITANIKAHREAIEV